MTQVTLPNGITVQLHAGTDPESHKDGFSGYVDPALLLPDEMQPRRHMDEVKLDELTQSVEASGVRENICVTPVSTVTWRNGLKQKANGCPFLIVSGHRRQKAAISAGIPAVPIVVRVYDSEMLHQDDASLLNDGREDLTPIEEAYEVKRLVEIHESVNKVAKIRGRTQTYTQGRYNLTQLHPDIQALIDPSLKPKERLSTTVASTLGGLKTPTVEELEDTVGEEFQEDISSMTKDKRRFALQHWFLSEIQERNYGSIRAVSFILDHKKKVYSSGGSVKVVTRARPEHRREIIQNLARSASDSVVFDWTQEEFVRIFASSGKAEVEEAINNLQSTSECLIGVVDILTKILESKEGSFMEQEMVVGVPYYHPDDNEFISRGTVSYRRYIELWDEKCLSWLKDGTPRPKHFPSLEEARKKAGLSN